MAPHRAQHLAVVAGLALAASLVLYAGGVFTVAPGSTVGAPVVSQRYHPTIYRRTHVPALSRSSNARHNSFLRPRRTVDDIAIPILRDSISTGHSPFHNVRDISEILRGCAGEGEKKGPEFFSAKIDSIKPAFEGSEVYYVVVDAPKIAEKYQIAGQFAQMRVDGESKPGFFAMANKPGSEKLEFLIKTVDGTAGKINALNAGDPVEITDVMGKGFPWDKVKDNSQFTDGTYVFATGTGFGPIRAMIEAGTFKGRKNMKIYYGVKDENHLIFKEDFQNWMDQGLLGDVSEMPIVPVFSCESPETDKKYVQDVAVLGGDDLNPEKAAAIICGHFDMTGKLKERLMGEMGMPADNILTNF
eukprot:CAMPEP_0184483046 /NCGR_PEP_ID=MMETSP0113_2-20130426/4654_1 /TAXON_ID=91329 /ORGANISM="Norrisiella sphaerica, Strain BC52" /LENGTH=357 /DNA_ID=CAMNT_0026863177 /DNA_START=37 /DNA_END=1110 /DNA_ORIENTATION=+